MLQSQSGITAPSILAEKPTGFPRSPGAGDNGALRLRLRRQLSAHARCGTPITYKRLAGLLPRAKNGMSILRPALEQLMEEDARAGRPFVAALAVSASASGVPESWFFRKAESLGKFAGRPEGVEAFAFHAIEFHHSISHYSRPANSDQAACASDPLNSRAGREGE